MAELITQRANQLATLSVFADCFGAELYPLATLLEPLHADAGKVLMRQGDIADFFLIIESGSARVSHENADGTVVEIEVQAGRILGEIALLRRSVRIATVTAADELTGWIGGDEAFDRLIELPGVLRKLISTARQRLAAFITPIPIRVHAGTQLYLRPVLPGDSARTTDGPVEFSGETLYRRFMTAREPTPALMDYLFQVDYVAHFVWVVLDSEDGNVVADARFVRDEADPTSAEIAFIVGDEYQGRGIGSFLMKALVIAAHVGGVEKFTARVLSDNLAMRNILARFGASWEREDLGVVTTTIDVPDLRAVHLPKPLITEIGDVARQVMQGLS
ncbi:MAG: GNAT family N-acetyltransferase [Mycobacterium sp.]|nr:GNAT family N-acetyltransferase [Mycobacterium sp.]